MFFNYKDLPLAFFFMLAIYGALIANKDFEKNFLCGLLLISLATAGAGCVKLAAMPLMAIQWGGLLVAAATSPP